MGFIINGRDITDMSREDLADAGITFGGSIVVGDQVGHSGGVHEGDLVINLDH